MNTVDAMIEKPEIKEGFRKELLRKMSSKEVQQLEERLKAQLLQLRSESEMFQRLMYKSKNQHRRCLYYRALSKVSRDLRLFETANLKHILKKYFQIIGRDNPAETLIRLERLKSTKKDAIGEDQKQLLGVARLLAQITEPIIEAGLQISTLLGQCFFMPFALTMLALLARLRVLLQQTLHDVVCIFNIFSGICQNKQSLKIKYEGLRVFKEYYPSDKPSLSLECHWDGVKFLLLEKLVEGKRNIPEMAMDAVETEQDSSSFGKGNREPSTSAAENNKRDATDDIATHIREQDTHVDKNTGHGGHLSLKEDSSKDGFGGNDGLDLGMKRKLYSISINSSSKTDAKSRKARSKLEGVYKDDHSATSPSCAKETSDPFFNLLFVENKNDSLF